MRARVIHYAGAYAIQLRYCDEVVANARGRDHTDKVWKTLSGAIRYADKERYELVDRKAHNRDEEWLEK